MQEKTKKIFIIVMLVLAVIASALAIVFAVNPASEGTFWAAYWITFVMIILAIAGILVFACVKFAKSFKENPKQARKTLLTFAIAIVVVLVSFLLAKGNDVSQLLLDKNNLTVGTSKWIGAACIMVYILVGAAALAILYVECSKLFKKK